LQPQQPQKDKQNVDFAPPGKISADAYALDISQMNTVQLYPQTSKHSKWLKNTISTIYNLRLAVP